MGGCVASSEQMMRPVQSDRVEGLGMEIFQDDGMSDPVDLYISCEDLPNLDIMSKTDPFAILYEESDSYDFKSLGRTEVISDNLNPNFVKSFSLKYFFEEKQPMKVDIYDEDDTDHPDDLSRQELVGSAEFMLHQVLRSPDQTLRLELVNSKRKNNGFVVLKADQLKKKFSSNIVKMYLEGKDLKGLGSLFFKLLRSKDSSTEEFFPIYQSECTRGDRSNYRWKTLKVSAAGLYRDDPNKDLKIELFEYKSNGNHKLIADHIFQFKSLEESHLWELSQGCIMFKNVELIKRVNISLALAIDFTSSNKDPHDSSSLHFLDPSRNQYMRAIHNVGVILQEYDSDKNISVFGFGANLPYLSKTSHCFALNGNIFAPEVFRIEGVLQAYSNSVSQLKFSTPTNFSEIIRYIGDMATFYISNNMPYNYFVLVILTDGIISDMQETIDEIVRCSCLPVSIIIIGVGKGNFSDMDKLDADVSPLYSSKLNKIMLRDIVQFVPFSKYSDNMEELARQTLGELPKQLVDYMTHMKIPPMSRSGRMSMHFGPSFFESRKKEFIAKIQSEAPPEQIEKILASGFPVEDPKDFLHALASGYKNPFSSQQL